MKKIFMILVLNLTFLSAMVYENGNERNTDGWRVYDSSPAGASISFLYDRDIQSGIIHLEGTGRRNGFMIGGIQGADIWNDRDHNTLLWEMKFDDRFVIYVSVETSNGQRYLTYSAIDNNIGKQGEYIYLGLGAETRDGEWHKIRRNVAEDVRRFEPENRLIAINGFLVRGSGFIDNIESFQGDNNDKTLTTLVNELALAYKEDHPITQEA